MPHPSPDPRLPTEPVGPRAPRPPADRARTAGLLTVLCALVMTGAWVLRGPSADLVARLAPTTATWPGVDALSTVTVVLLGGACAAAGWVALRDRGQSLAVALAGAVGVVLAYGASEALKALVRAERACTGLATVRCPDDSWGFPSNHTTVAVAGAVVVLFVVHAAPRQAPAIAVARWVVVALAVVSGVGRVLKGVHAPHEVVAGAALGAASVVVAVLLLAPAVDRALDPSTRRRAAHP